MGNALRKVFTSGITQEELKQIEQLGTKLKQHRDTETRLVRYNEILYSAEPFQGFIGDCSFCSHYISPNLGFVTGGDCGLHGIACGNGFTCKNNDSVENNGWPEFENIKNEK